MKKPYEKPEISEVIFEDAEIVSMSTAAKSELPLVRNPCAVGGIGGPQGEPLPGGFSDS